MRHTIAIGDAIATRKETAEQRGVRWGKLEGAFRIGDRKAVAATMLHAGDLFGVVSLVSSRMSTSLLEPAAMQRSLGRLGTRVAASGRTATHETEKAI